MKRRQGCLLCCSEKARSDEPPYRVRGGAAKVSDTLQTAGVAPWVASAMSHDPAETCKLVQVETTYFALVEFDGAYVLFRFNVPSLLRNVDRCTANTYEECLAQERLQLDEVAKQFRRRQRLNISDGDEAIANAERALGPGIGGATLRLTCAMHKLVGIAARSSKSIVTDVPAWIHMGLALRVGCGMARFKAELVAILQERLRLLRGGAGMAAARHREDVLELFCPVTRRRPTTLLRRAIVQRTANRDYSKSGTFEHYMLPGETEEEARETVLGPFVSAICASGLHVFARHGWNNSDRTLEWLGLLRGIYGLLREVFKRWCARYGTTNPGTAGNPSFPWDFESTGMIAALDDVDNTLDAVGGLGKGEDVVAQQRQRLLSYRERLVLPSRQHRLGPHGDLQAGLGLPAKVCVQVAAGLRHNVRGGRKRESCPSPFARQSLQAEVEGICSGQYGVGDKLHDGHVGLVGV